MSAHDPILEGLLRQAREKRLSGAFDAAVPLATSLLRSYPSRADVRDEALRTLLAAGRPEPAFQVLSAAAHSGLDVPPPPDVAARLAVDLELDVPLAGLTTAAAARWVTQLARDGREPHDGLAVARVRVVVDGGRLVYAFSGACPYCGHAQVLRLAGTLMTRRTRLCPACLGRMCFDWRMARDFLRRRHPRLVDCDYAEMDAPVARQVRRRVVGETDSPAAVDGLGQGYQFLLNEVILRLALDAAGDDAEAAP